MSLKLKAFIVIACESMLLTRNPPGENDIFLKLFRKENNRLIQFAITIPGFLQGRKERGDDSY